MRTLAPLLLLLWAASAAAGSMEARISRITLESGVAQAQSRQCAACHSIEFALWARHPHSHALIDPSRDPRLVTARWGKRVPGWSQNVEGRFERQDVKLAFGLGQVQVYFRASQDRHELLAAQWNLREGRWEPLSPVFEALRIGGGSWEGACAGCHTTGFRPEDGSFEEANVSCSACHGGGAAHASSGGREKILRPSSLDAPRRSEICGACHSRGVDRATGAPFPVGFVPGQSLGATLDVPGPGSDPEGALFWPDGTERLPYMEYQGFVQSGHYREGLSCVTCHLAHGSENARSLRRKANDLCGGCHGDAVERDPVHRAHPTGGADCVDCHMSPVSQGPEPIHVRSHTFRFLDPEAALRYGMPSSCTLECHADREPRWAAEHLARWRTGGDGRRP